MTAPDFDELYRGETQLGGMPRIPWDIGEPQPLVVELEAAGEFRGAVLDAGCGLGENALFLAGRGYDVTGIDGSPTAIERVRTKAAELGLDARFAVAEATRLDGFDGRFDTVLDSALYHCLTIEQQREYAATLHRVTRPGATLHLLCLAERLGAELGPMVITPENLRGTFGEGWHITRLERRGYTTSVMPENLMPEPPPEAPKISLDDRGRFLMPIWQLAATRA
ncbi:class I SAM-dependent methyltransferase [Amycolatopsis pithecellobii]|uniref:Methyltransferase domain-containing protein n=1 Tax=Amycolatopsis pithecellobii TaxID=664692 RepID=A0A6N7ZB29_9PSEU|nr:class I SAM-dependent methyltransferase [Amycolatopsis pithecellobii]MTD58966.1 methyltransferase domain-containing protein [Amycolatopsis pithecellobii]